MRNTITDELPASPKWQGVHSAATAVLEPLPVAEFVDSFASVRQGVQGRPQAVDRVSLETVLSEWRSDPETSLTRLSRGPAVSPLDVLAEPLLETVKAAAGTERQGLREATDRIQSLLGDSSLSDTAAKAREVAKHALDNGGLFRPNHVGGWAKFEQACLYLERVASAPEPADLHDAWDVVAAQSHIRKLAAVAERLSFVRECIGLTVDECERRGSGERGPGTLRQEVEDQLRQVQTILTGVGEKGDTR